MGSNWVRLSICMLGMQIDWPVNSIRDCAPTAFVLSIMMRTNWLLVAVWPLCLLPTILLAFDYCDPVLCPGPEKHIACNNFGVSSGQGDLELLAPTPSVMSLSLAGAGR